MEKTSTGLIEYARAQLGRPYWMGTFGQTATEALYNYNKGRLPAYYTADDFPSQYGQRVHDCIGLIKGYLWSSGADAAPVYCAPPCTADYSADAMLTACKERGPISTLPELPGTLVFLPEHVGVYIGGGEVIEARGHAYGVVQTQLKARAWKNWGICPFITYEEDDDMTYEKFKELMAQYESEKAREAPGAWSETARQWAVKEGIFQGGADGEMRWKAPLTREEYAVTEYRINKE